MKPKVGGVEGAAGTGDLTSPVRVLKITPLILAYTLKTVTSLNKEARLPEFHFS